MGAAADRKRRNPEEVRVKTARGKYANVWDNLKISSDDDGQYEQNHTSGIEGVAVVEVEEVIEAEGDETENIKRRKRTEAF